MAENTGWFFPWDRSDYKASSSEEEGVGGQTQNPSVGVLPPLTRRSKTGIEIVPMMPTRKVAKSIKVGDDELSVDSYTRLDFDELTQGYLVTRYKPGQKPPRFMSTGTQTVPEKPIKPRRGRNGLRTDRYGGQA